MRPLQLLALSGLMLASNIALAAELERDDIPHRCWDVCSPVVDTAQQCDSTYRDDDRAEMDCICGWNQASTLVPLCEACIAEYRSSNDHDDDDDDDDRNEVHDNDAYDILTSCSFSTTTYNTAAASSILSTATSTVATNSATTTQSSSGSSSTGSSGTTGTSQSSSNTNTGSNAQATNNSAAGSAVPKAASVAAVVGLIGLAWL